MDIGINMWLAPFIGLFVVTLPDVLGAPVGLYKNLTARAGDEITLKAGPAGLQGDYLVSRYFGTDEETLMFCEKGKILIKPPERFDGRLHLNTTTGCLKIQDLSINDNGVYQVQVIDGNNKRTVYNYTVTVSEAAGSSPNTAQRNHLALVLTVLPSVAVCIELFA